MSFHKNTRKVGSEVFLNVYDLVDFNDYLYNIGFGLFHSGVEINGVEYSFAEGSGISEGIPKEVIGAKFRESILMGTTYLSNTEIDKRIDDLREVYKGNQYHMILKNCNNFSNDLCMALLNEPIPGYVNRCAYIGSFFSCLFPKQDTEDDLPVKRFSGEAQHLTQKSSTQIIDKEQQRLMRLRALEANKM